MKIVSLGLALLVSLVLVGSALAQDKSGDRGPRGARGEQFPFLRGLNLTDDQKAKVKEITKEFAPKLKELAEKRDGVLTADQKKAREDAVKAAKDAGKNIREQMQAGREAVKLTDEQKKTMAEVRKDQEALNKQFIEKIQPILTDDQKAKLKENLERRGNRRTENT
jgi:Spy/CpxP family protein refolding chaperone